MSLGQGHSDLTFFGVFFTYETGPAEVVGVMGQQISALAHLTLGRGHMQTLCYLEYRLLYIIFHRPQK